jgi:beta-glucanase (GH16 family)
MLALRVLLLILLTPFISTTSSLIPAPLKPTIKSPDAAQSKYRLTWFDNFDSNTLNKTVWTSTGEGKVGKGDGVYYKRNANIRVADGTLNLDCKKETFKNSSGVEVTAYTVGRILTRQRFNRGYFEARMKLPKAGESLDKSLHTHTHTHTRS